MEKYGQAIGGIKSQQRILRERVDAIERDAESLGGRVGEIERRADKLAFRINLLLVFVLAENATLIIGFLLK